MKKLFFWLFFLSFSVPLLAEVEITVDLIIEADYASKHELNRMVVFDGGRKNL